VKTTFAFAVAVLLSACAGEDPAAVTGGSSRPQVRVVIPKPGEPCRVSEKLVPCDAVVDELQRQFNRTTPQPKVVLVGRPDSTFERVGSVISAVQEAGYVEVTFVAE
jgi:biopolymer transport protein ExbD